MGYPLRRFPIDLKLQLAQRAERENTNLNDVAVGILAEAFGIRSFVPSHRRTRGLSDSDYLNLEMPESLRRRINMRAAGEARSGRDLIVQILSERVKQAA